jgi:putative ABC transport system permease protein
MIKYFLKTALRNLIRNPGYSLINIGGLATGIVVVMFIGLWIYDELSFNKYHKNYSEIAQVWSCSIDPETLVITGGQSIQYPVSISLLNNYTQYFKHVLMAWWVGDYTLSPGDKKFNKKGEFVEGGALEMLSLKMLKGSYESLNDLHSIVLSRSTAESIFGKEDPINKSLSIDNSTVVQVTGIYDDIPANNRFSGVQFFAPWNLWLSFNKWAQGKEADWENSAFNIYVQLQPGVTMENANAAIKDLYYKNVPADFYKTMEKYKPFIQLIPMSKWHLYSELKDGKPAEGRITYVWLFGLIGIFVLLLACINFINLSTARSEKRAREVGIRKTTGSSKLQLIRQFLSESFMVVVFAFILALFLVVLLKNQFNVLSGKDIVLPVDSPAFWVISIIIIAITSFIAGIYPAFYLSSFPPVKVLNSISRSGRFAVLPRKVLVVFQFAVSVVLVVGTLIVYLQIQYGRNRPIGYDRNNLITLPLNDPNYKNKQNLLKTELLRTGVVSDAALSSTRMTHVNNLTKGYNWPGKDPSVDAEFATCNVTLDFGKTVGWKFAAGRDFSNDFGTDSLNAIIVNEAAVKYMKLKNPVGQEFTAVDEFGQKEWTRTIIGVVKDLIMESPYDPVQPTLYFFNANASLLLLIKINPAVSANIALPKIEAALNKVVPSALFDYKFVDEEYALKFIQEERIGKLSGVFSILAIFISCLGLFGLASYIAEQRTKEIGIRKVMGATVPTLWQMLTKDFIVLVFISCFIAIPLSYYLMNSWLQKYQYRIEISWWIFLIVCIGALIIMLMTVSFHAIRAALMDPVKSLRSE